MTYDIVEGTSDVLQFQLLENGVPIDLSTVTVTILMEDRTGTAVPNPGAIVISDAANGRIQFTPTSTAVFVAVNGPYFVRWVLTVISTNAVSYVPSGGRDMWNIDGL